MVISNANWKSSEASKWQLQNRSWFLISALLNSLVPGHKIVQMLIVYIALKGDKFLQEESIGSYDICENNVWPRKLKMIGSWKSSRESISNCFPHLEAPAFEYMTEHDTELLESLSIPSTGIIFYVVVLCARPGEYVVLAALRSHSPSLRLEYLYTLDAFNTRDVSGKELSYRVLPETRKHKEKNCIFS